MNPRFRFKRSRPGLNGERGDRQLYRDNLRKLDTKLEYVTVIRSVVTPAGILGNCGDCRDGVHLMLLRILTRVSVRVLSVDFSVFLLITLTWTTGTEFMIKSCF